MASNIKKVLCMYTDTIEILVGPERKKFMFHVKQVKKGEEMKNCQSSERKRDRNSENNHSCNTYNEIAAVLVYLL